MSKEFTPCKHCGNQPVKTMIKGHLLLVCPQCKYEVNAPLELAIASMDFPVSAAIENYKRLEIAKAEVTEKWNEYNEYPKEILGKLKERLKSYNRTLENKLEVRENFALEIAKVLLKGNRIATPNIPDAAVMYADEILERLAGVYIEDDDEKQKMPKSLFKRFLSYDIPISKRDKVAIMIGEAFRPLPHLVDVASLSVILADEICRMLEKPK